MTESNKKACTILLGFSYGNDQYKYYQINHQQTQEKFAKYLCNVDQKQTKIPLSAICGYMNVFEAENTNKGEPVIQINNLLFRFITKREDIFYGIYFVHHFKKLLKAQRIIAFFNINSPLSQQKINQLFPNFYGQHSIAAKQIKTTFLSIESEVKKKYLFYNLIIE